MASSKTLACDTPLLLHLALNAVTVSRGSSACTLQYTRSLYRRLTSVLVVVFLAVRIISFRAGPRLHLQDSILDAVCQALFAKIFSRAVSPSILYFSFLWSLNVSRVGYGIDI